MIMIYLPLTIINHHLHHPPVTILTRRVTSRVAEAWDLDEGLWSGAKKTSDVRPETVTRW